MGWNIFYKECKYLAAHRILKILNRKGLKYRENNLGETPIDFNDINIAHRWVELKEVHKESSWFPLLMLKNAVMMMFNTSPDIFLKEVDILNNKRVGEIQVKILWEGKTALKDRKYVRAFFKSAKVIVPIILGLLSTIFGTIVCLMR